MFFVFKKKLTKDLATKAMNTSLSVMYGEGFWIRSHKGLRLAGWLQCFLNQYQKAAYLCYVDQKLRFSMIPKVHCLHHIQQELLQQSQRSNWAINPLATSNQVQEDFVGRPSRVSRRVSVRLVHRRVLDRGLLVYKDCLERAQEDTRGMNAYPCNRAASSRSGAR